MSFFEHTVVAASDFKNCMVVNSEIIVFSRFGFELFFAQVHAVRQSEKSGSLECTSSLSQSFNNLTIERESVGTAQVHSDLNKLSAEAAAVVFRKTVKFWT